jgi:autotransporter-associated beta strand protein
MANSLRDRFALSLALLALGLCGEARAASVTWVGGTNAFDVSANWSGNTLPDTGDSLVFGASGAGALNNNLTSASVEIAGITFDADAGAFVIGDGTGAANVGNAFTLTGAVTNNSIFTQTINDSCSMSAARSFVTTAGGGNLTLGGTVSGAGGIHAMGGGTLTLTGSNTYGGVTSIASGTTLRLGAGGATGSITGDVSNSGTLVIHRSNDVFYEGVIGGNGGLTIDGGAFRPTAAQTYTGATRINFGYLVLPPTRDFGISASTVVTVAAGGALDLSNRMQKIAGLEGAGRVYSFGGIDGSLTLDVAAGETHTFSGTLGDSDAGFYVVKSGPGTQIFANDTTYSGGTLISEGTLQIGAGGATGSFIGGIVNNATLDFHRSDDFTFSGGIYGSGAVVLNVNKMRLTFAQGYTGPTQINSGTLVLPTAVDFGLAASTVVTVAAGAALDLSNRAQKIAGLEGAGQVYSLGGASGSLTLEVGAGQSHTFSGRLGGDYPNFAVTKSGPGTQILSGHSYHAGGIFVNDGVLQLGDGAQTAVLQGGSGANGAKAATLGAKGDNGGVGDVTVTLNGGMLRVSPLATLVGGTGGVGGAGGTSTYILGAGEGGNGGVGGTGVLLPSAGSVINNGLIAGGSGGSGGDSNGDEFDGGKGGNGGGGILFNAGGSLVNGGTILGGPGGLGGSNAYRAGASGIRGTAVIYAGGAGTLTNQSGGLIVGSVSFEDFANAVTLETGSTIEGALSLAGAASTLTLTGSGAQAWSGAVTGATTFAGSLAKTGTGTWTLDRAFNYTGATTVTVGTLVVDGSIAASSGVSISAGAKLTGHGVVSTIGGAGLVAPGDPQILTATSVDPSGGLDFTFNFTQPGAPDYTSAAASGNDILHLTGATPIVLALDGANTITLDFTGAAPADGQVYYGGFFTDASVPGSLLDDADFAYAGPDGFTARFAGWVAQPVANFASGTVTDGWVASFQVAAVPESGTLALALIGTAGLLLARWKRQNRAPVRARRHGLSRV